MIFFIVGIVIFCFFDAAELIKKSRLHEKILFSCMFFAVFFLGVWYYSDNSGFSAAGKIIEIMGINII